MYIIYFVKRLCYCLQLKVRGRIIPRILNHNPSFHDAFHELGPTKFAENPIVIYYEVVNMRDKTRSQT